VYVYDETERRSCIEMFILSEARQSRILSQINIHCTRLAKLDYTKIEIRFSFRRRGVLCRILTK